MRDAQIVKLPMGTYPVPDYRGLRLIVGAGGTRSWSWRRRLGDGRLVQTALGHWPKVSMQDAITTIETLKAGNVDPTVGDLIDAYVGQHLRLRRATPERTIGMLEKHCHALRGEKARLVTVAVARAFLSPLTDRPATQHMLRRELVAIWAHAGRETNPWQIVKTRGNPPKQRALSPTELVTWYQWVHGGGLSATVRDVLMLCLLTGCRSGELVGMRKEAVDLDRGEWHLGKTKNGQGRTVMLNRWACSIVGRRMRRLMDAKSAWHFERGINDIGILDNHVDSNTRRSEKCLGPCVSYTHTSPGPMPPSVPGWPDAHSTEPIARHPTTYLFPSRSGGHIKQPRLVNALCRVRSTCLVDEWSIHDIRRSARTGWARIGVPDSTAELMMGHKLGGILGVYQTYKFEPEQKEWAEKWGSYLEDLLLPNTNK